MPTGNVYLYSGNAPGVTSAQKLILAQTATVETTVSVEAEFQAFGIARGRQDGSPGPAAGKQGAVTIGVSCDKDTPALPDFTIPAGTTAKTTSTTYTGIPAGAVCTVTETDDGHTETISSRPSGVANRSRPGERHSHGEPITDTVNSPRPGR